MATTVNERHDGHSTSPTPPSGPLSQPVQRKPLSPAAQRALAEAEERRMAANKAEARPKELHGSKGPEPTRYGDWEHKGIASDF